MQDEQFSSAQNVSRPDATSRDMSRPVTTSDDYISIKDAREIFITKGRKITERTLQRYCEKQYLDGKKHLTAEGEKWFVLRSSVLTRIAELDAFDKLRPPTTSDDMSAPVAELNEGGDTSDKLRQENTDRMSSPVVTLQQSQTTSDDMTRPVATSRDSTDERETPAREISDGMSSKERELYDKYIQRLEIENDGLRADKEKLYSLLDAGNAEKMMLIESDRDSKSIAKNNNSLVAYLTQFFKGKDALDAPTRDVTYGPENFNDTLRGDERGV